jgi:hypothetical protein
MANRHYALAFAREMAIPAEDCRQAVDQHGRWGVFYRRG